MLTKGKTMTRVANLLTEGNGKLGERGIFVFSLPVHSTCPGSTPTCRACCYADSGQIKMQQHRYRSKLESAKADSFVSRMVAEIRRGWIGCVRFHVSGDFFSAEYVAKWEAIARALPHVRFYGYTRSWRVPGMALALASLARLGNVRLYFSCDKDSGVPARVPARVRLAYLQTAIDDLPPASFHDREGVIFRVRKLRSTVAKRIGLVMVCPVENGATKHRTDCARCKVCIF